MMRYRFLAALLLILSASCAVPTASLVSPASDLALTGTAQLVFTTPYGQQGRALALYQSTIEPQNLGLELTDFVVTLNSASLGGSVTKTVPVAEASRVALMNLPAASDWSFTVVGRKAGVVVAQFAVPAGQLTTIAGETTNLGDVTLAPVAATGSSPYSLVLSDLPPRVSGQNVTFDLQSIDASGNVLNVDLSAMKSAVTLTWTETTLTLVSTAVPTGTYRLTLHFKTETGANDPLQPVFLLKLYPNLASSAVVSTSRWAGVSAATVTLGTPRAQATGFILPWQPNDLAGAAAYDWIWLPTYDKAAPPSPLVEQPSAPALFGTVVPTTDFARANPAITRDPTAFNAEYATSKTWVLFVRSISPTGEVGAWTSSGNIDVRSRTFPVRINTLTLYGLPSSGYGRVLTTAHSSVGNATFYAEPILAAHDFLFPGVPTGTTVVLNGAVINPDQFLTVQTPSGFVPVLFQVDQTHPPVAGTGNDYDVYQADLSGLPYLAVYPTGTFPQVAAGDWSVTNTPEATLSSSALHAVAGMIQNNFQLATLDYDANNRPSLSFSYESQLPADDTPHAANWPVPTWAAQVVHSLVRGSWTNGSLQVWGPWSADKFTFGSGPISLTASLNSSILTWNQLPWTWGTGSAVVSYRLYADGVWKGDLPAQNTGSMIGADVASLGQGDYTVTALIRRSDGTTFESNPSAPHFLAWASLPSSVLKDDGGREPGALNYDAAYGQGRGLSVIADTQAPGWIITGTTGAYSQVFNTRVGQRGDIDPSFGQFGNGMIYLPPDGQYFPESVGAAQNPSTGQILMNDYLQNGLGYDWLGLFTKQGVPDVTLAGTGSVLRGDHILPAARPVFNATTGEYVILEYWEYLVQTKVTSLTANGTETHSAAMPIGANSMAVQSNGNVVLAGDGGWVRRFDSTLNSLSATALTVGGNAPNWTGVAVDPADDGIVLVGTYGSNGYVVRLTAAGAFDTNFDTDGAVIIPGFWPRDVAVGPGNVLYAVGDTEATESLTDSPFLAAINASGASQPATQTLPGTTTWGGGARGVAVDSLGHVGIVGFAKNDGVTNSANTKPMFWEIVP